MVTDAPWTADQPWLPYLATEYIREFLTSTRLLFRSEPRSVFEWGSGGSTIFFERLGIPYLVSIEHDPEWYGQIGQHLKAHNIEHPDYHLIPYEAGEIGSDKANPAHYKSGSTELGPVNFKKYVSAIDQYGKFDLILIDGMARASCLYHAISHVNAGGCIVLDNVGDRPYYLEQTDRLFGNYENGWERIVFTGYGPILDYQWSTLILKNIRKSDYE
jgi:hypothetical protein